MSKKKKSRKGKILLSLLVIFFSIIGIAGIYLFTNVNSFFNQINDGSTTYVEQDNKIENEEPLSFLILGLDAEASTDGAHNQRTDTIMVATVNPIDESIKLTSIPRDTVVELEDGQVEKINAMYAIGGVDLAKEAVEDLLHIPIDFYTLVEFQTVIEVVDAIGGITVDSDFAFTVDGSDAHTGTVEIKEGVQHLDGEQALGYSRMRMQDPRGDFGRQIRQQEVIVSILDKLFSFSTLPRFHQVLEAAGPYVQTDLAADQIISLGMNYRNSINNIDHLIIDGTDSTMYFPEFGFDLYIFKPYEDAVLDIRTELQRHLGISLSQDTSQYNSNRLNILLQTEEDQREDHQESDAESSGSQAESLPMSEPALEENPVPEPGEAVEESAPQPSYQAPVYEEPVYQEYTYQEPAENYIPFQEETYPQSNPY